MPGPFDANLMLRQAAAGDLTASENTASLAIRSTPVRGMAVRVIVPQAAGTSPTLDLSVQESADDTNFDTIASHPQLTDAETYPQEVVIPFSTTEKYVRLSLTVGGTSPNFGVVIAGLTLASRELDRSADFS